MALRNTKLIRAYVDLDSRVKPLIILIKYWAKRRALNDGIS
jgi:DNA polymerase sigma